ncbi:MAG: HEAT repeat domain-containing protein [Altibacter sp.]|uniref:HEAT repeat domain-containing protein n=1 Tax=Altibacter sp. TaxID=2024823 RepID=UPI001E15EFE2|nr:HEAT repeat domain-containing protein [Altibacter sp.]MBZ0328336.1 HEAT repeat domain-containing protein [Altibacter sp.]
MGFYALSKEERVQKVADIQFQLQKAVEGNDLEPFLGYFSEEDTYIRKAAYQGVGRIYNSETGLREGILELLQKLHKHDSELIRQTVVNAAGEIGLFQFEKVQAIFDTALFDSHHKVRNAVIGSLKKMSQKNPKPSLTWAKQYLTHPDLEIRRQVCHGIELRGRTHPEDILPLLHVLQDEKSKRVRDTLVHVLGQISYKKGCLPKVIKALQCWTNKAVVLDALDEIVDVHSEERYAAFSTLSQQQVISYITKHMEKT